MTREEVVNSMSLQDAIQVFKDTNAYGTMDIAKSVILKALEQEPCGDAISRQAVIDATVKKNSIWNSITNSKGENLEEIISQLPPVNPAEKVGRWIDHQEDRWIYAKCSECNTVHDARSNYCPNCGAKMGGEQNG